MFGRFYSLIVIVAVLLSFGTGNVLGQQGSQLGAAEVLARYSESCSWLQSVSMKIDIQGTPQGLPGKGPYGVSVVFRHDAGRGRAEWVGRIFGYDENGNVDPNNNHTVNEIFTGKRYFSFTHLVGRAPIGALMSEKSQEPFEMFMDDPTNGGPLWGRIYGNDHKSVADLLAESTDLYMLGEQENINGTACYVLGGTTRYGKATAWIAPEKGYSALRWSIEKSSGDFFNSTELSGNLWGAVFDEVELQNFNGVYVPVKGVFTRTDGHSDSDRFTITEGFKVSDVQLNPDFAGLHAFSVNLPDDTWVQVQEALGIRYVWKGGKVVPAADGPTFDEIDRMMEELKN